MAFLRHQLQACLFTETLVHHQPSVKLVEKIRKGSRVVRRYSDAYTPLDRLAAYYGNTNKQPLKVKQLLAQRQRLDPFALAKTIEEQRKHLSSRDNQQTHKEQSQPLRPSSPQRGRSNQPQPPF